MSAAAIWKKTDGPLVTPPTVGSSADGVSGGPTSQPRRSGAVLILGVVGAFLMWAGRRLAALIWSGAGALSTLLTLALVVVPSFWSLVPRWGAAVPVVGYVVVALLWEEYVRIGRGCLTATVSGFKGRYRLEIRNCGSVAVEDVKWEFLGEQPGWVVIRDADGEPPPPTLDPGQKFIIPFFIAAGAAAQTTVRLSGVVGGRGYQRDKLVSKYGG